MSRRKNKDKDSKRVELHEEQYYNSKDDSLGDYDPADFEDGANGVYLENDEYNVEEICDMKIENGKKLYFIKWDGYPHSQNTWEPVEHLDKVLYMVEQFEEEYAKKKSLVNIQKENPRYFRDEEDIDVNESESRKNGRARDLNDEQEVIVKKKKLTKNDKGEDKKHSNLKEPAKDIDPLASYDEAVQEITTFKEDMAKSNKKREKKPQMLVKGTREPDELPTRAESTVSSVVEKSSKESVPETKTVNKEAPVQENIKPQKEPEPEKVVEMVLTKAKEPVMTTNAHVEPKPVIKPVEQKEVVKPIEVVKPVEVKEVKAPVIVKTKPSKNLVKTLKSTGGKKITEKNVKPGPKKKDKTGSFRNKDRPKAILSIKPGKHGGLMFLVEWQMRSDGTLPENTYVSSEDMKQNDPYFLIDFYESKMIMINKKEKKKRDKQKAAALDGLMEHIVVDEGEVQNVEEAKEMNQIEKPPEVEKSNKEPEAREAEAGVREGEVEKMVEEAAVAPANVGKEGEESNEATGELQEMIENIDKMIEEKKDEKDGAQDKGNPEPEESHVEAESNKMNAEPNETGTEPKIVVPELKEGREGGDNSEKMNVEEPNKENKPDNGSNIEQQPSEEGTTESKASADQGNLVSVGS